LVGTRYETMAGVLRIGTFCPKDLDGFLRSE
jgi:hypothetical protein